jgi:teichuronic acid biosynthesis glycosyltransferase TuaC
LKILFVSSGNTLYGISPITRNQGLSIEKLGVDVIYFPIEGKGFRNYLSSIFILRKHLRVKKYDLIHAHYSLAGFVAALSGSKPLVVSLMGSDSKHGLISKSLIKFFSVFFWDKCIVKSSEMQNSLKIAKTILIPNGVDLIKFQPILKETAQSLIGWDNGKIHILFGANKNRTEKNFSLAQLAISKLNTKNIVVQSLNNVNPELIPLWLNASDVVMLTSLWEGSPNIIKEAMACNRPIVSTNVGDVEWLLGDIKGHFITTFDPHDVSEKLNEALKFSASNESTKGRERILELGLDSKDVAQKLLTVYKSVSKEIK